MKQTARRNAVDTTFTYLIAVANAANMGMFSPAGRPGVVRLDRCDPVVADTLDDLADIADAASRKGPPGIRAFWRDGQRAKVKATAEQLTALWDRCISDILDELDPKVPRDSASMAEWLARQAGLRS